MHAHMHVATHAYAYACSYACTLGVAAERSHSSTWLDAYICIHMPHLSTWLPQGWHVAAYICIRGCMRGVRMHACTITYNPCVHYHVQSMRALSRTSACVHYHVLVHACAHVPRRRVAGSLVLVQCACICACICVCICVCICACICVCICMCRRVAGSLVRVQGSRLHVATHRLPRRLRSPRRYTHTHTRAHVHARRCARVYVHACRCAREYVHVHACGYIRAGTPMQVRTCMRTCMCTRACARVPACMHAYARIRTHTSQPLV